MVVIENLPTEMESRVALLEETVAAIQSSVTLLRKLAEEHTSGLSDIRKYIVKTEEIEQLRAVAKAMQIEGFDGDEECIDAKEEKEEAGLISSELKGKDVSNELEERKDECPSQLKEDDMSTSNLMQLADQSTLSDKQCYPEEPAQFADQSTLPDEEPAQFADQSTLPDEDQAELKIYAELVSLTQLSAVDKNALVKLWQVFGTFQEEAEKMTDTIKLLKKEKEALKTKLEAVDSLLVITLRERMQMWEELETTKSQNTVLQKLCRTLQEERKQNKK